MEIWQIAAAFGADYERPDDDGGDNPNHNVRSSGRDLLAERMAYSRGEGPKPEAEKPGADVLNVMNTIKGG